MVAGKVIHWVVIIIHQRIGTSTLGLNCTKVIEREIPPFEIIHHIVKTGGINIYRLSSWETL
jgi:hypothetical protein